MTEKMGLVGPDGKTEVVSERYAPCPNCGREAKERVPSCGFGTPHLVCPCGKEFVNLTVQQVLL